MDDETKFQRLVQFRVSDALSDAIDAAAIKHLQTKSEYVRQSVLTGLRLDGFEPAAVAPRDAGSLYNVTPDGRHWALVAGDTVKSRHRSHDKPADEQGGVWLPIDYEDSEPFDIDRHWRLAPVTGIEADRVVVTYPIVSKSMDLA
jgi:hypothetical protein